MLESKLEAQIRRYAQQKGCLFYKFVSPGTSGVPDRILVSPKGKIAFLEIKAPGRKPRPLQRHEIKKLNDRGVKATWVDSFPAAVFFINALVVNKGGLEGNLLL